MNKYWKSSLLLPILFQASLSSATEQKLNANNFQDVEQKMYKNRKGLLPDENLAYFPIPNYFNSINHLNNTNKSQTLNHLYLDNKVNRINLDFLSNPISINNFEYIDNNFLSHNHNKDYEDYLSSVLILPNSSNITINNKNKLSDFIGLNNSFEDTQNILISHQLNHFINAFIIFYLLSSILFLIIITQNFVNKYLKIRSISFWTHQLFLLKNKIKNIYNSILFFKQYIKYNIRKIEHSINFKTILLSRPYQFLSF